MLHSVLHPANEDQTAPSAQISYEELALQLEGVLSGARCLMTVLANASALIYDALDRLNWCGFYFLQDGLLLLGPFQGKVACMEIRLDRGVCGAAFSGDKTLVVADVHAFPGHIACDCASNSEIVIPLHKNGKTWGVLDIDSPCLARFTEADREGLEHCARIIEKYL